MTSRAKQSVLLLLLFLIPGFCQADLIMGIFPRRPIAVTHKAFKPLAAKMSAALGEKVTLVTPRDFQAFWRGVTSGQYDIVHFNQYHYIVSHKKMGYRILVTNKEFGSRTIAGALSVRKDSNIKSLKDLKGKTIIFGGGRQAMGSYIAPTAMLKRAGLVAGRDYKVRFANNPPSAVIATYTGIADAGGCGDIILRIQSVKNHIDIRKIRILAVSEPFIHLAWATHPRISREKAERIRHFMLSLENSPTGRVILKSAYLTGFYKATDKDFDKVREIVFYTLGEKY